MTMVDIVIGLDKGDESKGKVTNHLIKSGQYDFVCAASGGSNKGHTSYVDGQKVVTHQIPCGVFHGITSVIGAGCVIHPEGLFKELHELLEFGIDARKYLKIAYNAHVITNEHIKEDANTDKIGSTKRGVMPAYRAKYGRTGQRASNITALQKFICDPYELFHLNHNGKELEILVEGAQGYFLCPDHGDYPFVTSSPPSSAYAFHSLGLPVQSARKIVGCAKAYSTYVGAKPFEPKEDIFSKIREAGEEFGATTGRPRKCNWLNIDEYQRAILMNGCTDVVISKMDVLREVGVWKIRWNDGSVQPFANESDFKDFIELYTPDCVEEISFSSSKEKI